MFPVTPLNVPDLAVAVKPHGALNRSPLRNSQRVRELDVRIYNIARGQHAESSELLDWGASLPEYLWMYGNRMLNNKKLASLF